MFQLIPRRKLASDLLDSEPKVGSYNGVTSDGLAHAFGDISELIPDDASSENKLATQGDVTVVAEQVEALGQPLQWKGPATVSELNEGIEGIQPGWTYTLTDAGTLTDGSVAVEAGDEVAWTEDDEWFKVGGESSKIAVFYVTYSSGLPVYPDADGIIAAINSGKFVVIDYPNVGIWAHTEFLLDYAIRGAQDTLIFVNGQNTLIATRDNTVEDPAWEWTAGYRSQPNIAPDYESLTFPIKEETQCIHNGFYYYANQDIATSEDWTAAHWTQTSVAAEIGNMKFPLPEAIAPEYDATTTYPTIGTAVMHDGLRYVSNTAITTAEDWTPAHWTKKSVEDEIGNVEALLAAL